MDQYSLLKELADENGGVLTPLIADRAGVAEYALRSCIKRNSFIRVRRGIYWDPCYGRRFLSQDRRRMLS